MSRLNTKSTASVQRALMDKVATAVTSIVLNGRSFNIDFSSEELMISIQRGFKGAQQTLWGPLMLIVLKKMGLAMELSVDTVVIACKYSIGKHLAWHGLTIFTLLEQASNTTGLSRKKSSSKIDM